MNKVQIEDSQILGNLEFIDWDQLRNSMILITGATGLIGSNLVNALAYNSIKKGLNIRLVLSVRNPEVAKEEFSWFKPEIIKHKLGEELQLEHSVDYIVHLASPTSSKFFIANPADTMRDNIDGYISLLEWTRTHPVKKFIGMSTMEVYGFPTKGHVVSERDLGAFETMNARNSYPIAKLACEALCNGYWVQYGIPAVILRATQTFGPGVRYDDGRVFAQFMRCAIEGKNIVLKTHGETERSYLYTADAVSAILVALEKGAPGEAYTIANPHTYCSISDMAQLVAAEISKKNIKVLYEIADDCEHLGYADTLFMDLSVSKIEKLGWKPKTNLLEMYRRMIAGLEQGHE